MISIIVPVFNEEESLRKNDTCYQLLAQQGELIFVDGGSTDRTVQLAAKLGRVLTAPKNRAVQMNKAAQEAKHDVLLFLHADAFINVEHLRHIERIMEDEDLIGGCLTQCLDDPALLYRWIAWTGNIRARVSKIFYGDQAIFVRKDVFEQLGGFPEVKIGEDVLFTKQLKNKGRVSVLPYPVHCSVRRWKKQGVLKTFCLNWRINTALVLGIDLDKLANEYSDVRGTLQERKTS